LMRIPTMMLPELPQVPLPTMVAYPINPYLPSKPHNNPFILDTPPISCAIDSCDHKPINFPVAPILPSELALNLMPSSNYNKTTKTTSLQPTTLTDINPSFDCWQQPPHTPWLLSWVTATSNAIGLYGTATRNRQVSVNFGWTSKELRGVYPTIPPQSQSALLNTCYMTHCHWWEIFMCKDLLIFLQSTALP